MCLDTFSKVGQSRHTTVRGTCGCIANGEKDVQGNSPATGIYLADYLGRLSEELWCGRSTVEKRVGALF